MVSLETKRAQARERRRRYRERNRELCNKRTRQWNSKNAERKAELYAEWEKENSERRWQLNAKTRARSFGATIIEDVDRVAVYLRDKGRCWICGKFVPSTNFHVDHIIRLADGGNHCMDNVRLAHPKCNRGRR